jgi:predicted flap endonuclease-1-like 5' DNA nuclease
MNSPSGLINLLIVWGVASAAGWLAMAALMIMDDWTVLQGLFRGGGDLLRARRGSVILVPQATFRTCRGGQDGPCRTCADGSRHGAAAVRQANGCSSEIGPCEGSRSETRACARARPRPAPAPAPAAADPGEGTRPAALEAAREGGADDLKRIKGIGPKLEKLCNSLGFYHFDQIANWTADEVAWVDQNLEGFKGRVTRDNWVEQARLLASGGETEFSKKVDKGDVY